MNGKKKVFYFWGSMVMFGFACVLMPRISKKLTGYLYKKELKR